MACGGYTVVAAMVISCGRFLPVNGDGGKKRLHYSCRAASRCDTKIVGCPESHEEDTVQKTNKMGVENVSFNENSNSIKFRNKSEAKIC